jgi:hypothetical protein
MALSASSSSIKTVVAVSEAPKVSSTTSSSNGGKAGGGLLPLPLPAKPAFQSSALQRTKSRKPVRKVAAAVQQEAPAVAAAAVEEKKEEEREGESVAPETDASSAGSMRVRKSAGKANSRTSRRRALVMCLALGMVRPCASTVENSESSQQQNVDLRRTVSAMPALRRTSSSSFKAPGSGLVSQVSLATTMKQTNLLGD